MVVQIREDGALRIVYLLAAPNRGAPVCGVGYGFLLVVVGELYGEDERREGEEFRVDGVDVGLFVEG